MTIALFFFCCYLFHYGVRILLTAVALNGKPSWDATRSQFWSHLMAGHRLPGRLGTCRSHTHRPPVSVILI